MTGDNQGRKLSEIMNGTVPDRNRTGQSRTSKRSVSSQAKKQKALSLRLEGRNYRDIAAGVGCSLSQAHRYVSAALDEIQDKNREIAEDVKVLELERLDALFKTAFAAVQDGDVRAIDQALKCMDRRARLLGLDAATRQEITGNLTASHEWIQLRGVLIKTLSEYPAAKSAIIAAIAQGGNGGTARQRDNEPTSIRREK